MPIEACRKDLATETSAKFRFLLICLKNILLRGYGCKVGDVLRVLVYFRVNYVDEVREIERLPTFLPIGKYLNFYY